MKQIERGGLDDGLHLGREGREAVPARRALDLVAAFGDRLAGRQVAYHLVGVGK